MWQFFWWAVATMKVLLLCLWSTYAAEEAYFPQCYLPDFRNKFWLFENLNNKLQKYIKISRLKAHKFLTLNTRLRIFIISLHCSRALWAMQNHADWVNLHEQLVYTPAQNKCSKSSFRATTREVLNSYNDKDFKTSLAGTYSKNLFPLQQYCLAKLQKTLTKLKVCVLGQQQQKTNTK